MKIEWSCVCCKKILKDPPTRQLSTTSPSTDYTMQSPTMTAMSQTQTQTRTRTRTRTQSNSQSPFPFNQNQIILTSGPNDHNIDVSTYHENQQPSLEPVLEVPERESHEIIADTRTRRTNDYDKYINEINDSLGSYHFVDRDYNNKSREHSNSFTDPSATRPSFSRSIPTVPGTRERDIVPYEIISLFFSHQFSSPVRPLVVGKSLVCVRMVYIVTSVWGIY